MNKQQHTLMKFDPAYGFARPYPSTSEHWRTYHGEVSWMYNPWTGDKRHPAHIESDPYGIMIVPPGESIYADDSDKQEDEHIRLAEVIAHETYAVHEAVSVIAQVCSNKQAEIIEHFEEPERKA